MPRYIDADKLMKSFADFVKTPNNSDFAPTPTWNDAVDIVENTPTADVVEVVRCKDCKYNPNNSDDDVCPFVEESGCYVKYFPEDDDFCKWGERRDDEL